MIDFAGTWTVAQPSQAGYRVKEILFGQDTEGVGRTDKVDGTMTIAGNAVTAGEFNVDLATVASDQTRRDNQFRTRLMNTDEFPVATYTIVEPIDLAAAGSGAGLTTKVVGTLSLRGVEKPVTVDVSAQRSGAVIQVTGSADIVFADFGIPDPSNAAVSTQNHGKFEFAITLAKSP